LQNSFWRQATYYSEKHTLAAIFEPSMQRTLVPLLVLFIVSACGLRQKISPSNNTLAFKVFFHPSFDEKAEIILTQIDTEQTIQFLIIDRRLPDKPTDTFYFKKISLTRAQFDNFDSLVIQKTKINQPRQWTGCCDGMPVTYQLIQGTDTSGLYFRSPDIKSDSSGYQITKSTINQLDILYKDSVITDYLHDIESYMDETKHHTKWNENRPINRLRKIEYSR
jgi:hypothetical protein